MNLNLEWVESPRPDWIDDLESMAEGYPFEKRKKELRDDAAKRCRSSWNGTEAKTRFLAAYFDAKLVGWIRVRPEPFLDERLKPPYLKADWELIQRNRDDLRERILDEIRETYPEALVEFSQPSQNRTARNFYRSQPDIRGGPTDVLVGHSPGEDPGDPPDSPVSLMELTDDEIEAIIPSGFEDYFPARSLLDGASLRSLFYDHLIERQNRHNAGGLTIPDKSDPPVLLYEFETEEDDGRTTTGHISYFHAGGGSDSASDLLARVESEFWNRGIEFVEARLDESKGEEHDLLLEHGFDSLSKRMYFFRIPGDVTLPLEQP